MCGTQSLRLSDSPPFRSPEFLCYRHGFLNPNFRLIGYPDRNPRQQYSHVLTSQKTHVR
jgi:hypothetical protein